MLRLKKLNILAILTCTNNYIDFSIAINLKDKLKSLRKMGYTPIIVI